MITVRGGSIIVEHRHDVLLARVDFLDFLSRQGPFGNVSLV